jgi:hypothetical protein
MNKRLEELMLEAGYAAPELAGRANKLAELIVKECAHAYHQTRGIDTTIEQHFRNHLGLDK